MTISDTFPNGLRIPQIIGAMRIQQERSLLLADQPGAGKTAQALVALELDEAFAAHRYNVLILCNVTGCQLTWSPEIHKRVLSQYPHVVFADLTHPGVTKTGRLKKTMPSLAERDDTLAQALMDADDTTAPLVVVANYEQVQVKLRENPKMSTLFGIRWDAIVIDESHLVLPTEKDGLGDVTQFWRGLMLLGTHANTLRVSISGTPDRGQLKRRYGHWKFLHPTRYTDYWNWARSQFVVTTEKVGVRRDPKTGRLIDVYQPMIGKLRDPEHWLAVDAQRMIRRTKREMLAGLPEKQWASEGAVELPMTPLQRNAYMDFQAYIEQRADELIAEGDDARASALKLQYTLRARQMATCEYVYTTTLDEQGREHLHGEPKVQGPEGSNKLAWLLNWMGTRGFLPDDFDADGGKVVITGYLTQSLEWLQRELEAVGVRSELLTGDTPARDKVRIADDFQTGDLRVVLLSGYLGVSINLDAADDMIFLDLVHDPDKIEQAEDRIHRASRNHQVTYWRLVSEDTADVAICQIIDARYRETRRTYDGVRGVEFARKWLTGTVAIQEVFA